MSEGAKKEFTPKMRPIESLRPKPKDLDRRTKLMITAASVLGIGMVAIGASGAISDSKAESEPYTTGQGTRETQLPIDNQKLLTPESTPFSETFSESFDQGRAEAINTVDQMKRDVLLKHTSLKDMIHVTEKNQQYIRNAAREFGIPEDVALGIVLIENGGGDDLTSPSGARGICQLMEKTAERYDLTVETHEEFPDKPISELVDDRVDPQKCTRAMANYLSDMRESFGGNLGFAVWGYHAGEGNVYNALREYFKDTKGVDLGDVGSAINDRELLPKLTSKYSRAIKEGKVNVQDVLSNRAVRDHVLVNLEDETELYPYKVVAGAELYLER